MEYADRLRITTPEGVELELTLAGIGSRFIAGMLDSLIQFVIGSAGLGVVFALLDGGVAVLVLSTLAFLLLFGYDVAFEVLAGGRTPGKRATGLRVVREGGAPVTFLVSAVRNVLRLIDILPFFYGVGMLVVFLTRSNQRLGDLAAGTIVVRERHGDRRPPAAVGTAIAHEAPAGWDTSAVTIADLATARAFLERRERLTTPARATLADDIAGRLRTKVAGAPAALEPEEFLEALVAARDR